MRSPRLAVAAALLVALGACSSGGGDGDGDGEEASDTTVPTTRPILTTTLATTTVPDLGGTAYVVQSGDTLGRIAADHGISLERLVAFNGISADTVLQPGHKLLIPPAEGVDGEDGATGGDEAGGDLPLGAQTYVIEAGDTFNAIAAEFGITLAELLAANDGLSADTTLHPGDEIVIPAPGSADTGSDDTGSDDTGGDDTVDDVPASTTATPDA